MSENDGEVGDAEDEMAKPIEQTERQRREIETYNARAVAEWREAIDLDHYSHERFGPWNPYWRTVHYALDHYPPKSNKLLAYGCGAGALGLRLAHMGYQVKAFDISDQLIRNAQHLAEKYGLSDSISFSVQSAENLEFESDAFDVVVGMNILHHIDLTLAVPELKRVLRPGGSAIFKDSLQTPFRDRLRKSWPVRALLPLGTKNRRTGEMYRPTADELPLGPKDIDLLEEHFSRVTVERFHVLTLLSKVVGNRPLMERCDWSLFRVLPFVRRLGDNVVIILEK
ncbi:MAG: class I SAM-dependent methyltransferase [Rubripirellula sp.]